METKPVEDPTIKIALEIYKARCQNFNFNFFGSSQEAVNKRKAEAAKFFEGEAEASFSIARRWIDAAKKYKANGAKSGTQMNVSDSGMADSLQSTLSETASSENTCCSADVIAEELRRFDLAICYLNILLAADARRQKKTEAEYEEES